MNYSDVLRIRAFRDLWLGQAISQLGDAFYYVTFMFMVKKITGQDEWVGYVGAAEALPFLLFGPYSGVLADRMDRKRIMLLSDIFSGGILVLFGLLVLLMGQPPAWSLVFMGFALSSIRCFFMPAKSAAIPNLVPGHLVIKANALSALTFNQAFVLGLALTAGVLGRLYETLSPLGFLAATVVINAASFLGSAYFIAKLPTILPDRKDLHEVHPMTDFKQGLSYIRKRRDLSVLLVLLTVFKLMVAPFFVVYVATNDAWFNGKPDTIAWFELSFFLGMLVVTGWMGKINISRPGLAFSLALATVGVTVAFMAFSPLFWLFILWNFLAGLFVPMADIPINSYLQLSVVDSFRGRVNAALSMITTGAMPLGMILGGYMVTTAGVSGSYLIMGLGMVAACMIGLVDREFRSIRMPTDEQSPQTPEAQPVLEAAVP